MTKIHFNMLLKVVNLFINFSKISIMSQSHLKQLTQRVFNFFHSFSTLFVRLGLDIKLKKAMRKLLENCQFCDVFLAITMLNNNYFSFSTSRQQSSWNGSLLPTKIRVGGYFYKISSGVAIGLT